MANNLGCRCSDADRGIYVGAADLVPTRTQQLLAVDRCRIGFPDMDIDGIFSDTLSWRVGAWVPIHLSKAIGRFQLDTDNQLDA